MFVQNRQKKEIVLSSFNGYKFRIPVGVSWIMDEAGQHLLQNIYNVKPVPPKDKYGFDNGNGVPPLLESTEKAWQKGGKQVCQVERFKINGKLVPRKKLIAVAQERGVTQSRVVEYLADPQGIDVQMIADDINNLPVPDSVRFPVDLEEVKMTPKMTEMAAN